MAKPAAGPGPVEPDQSWIHWLMRGVGNYGDIEGRDTKMRACTEVSVVSGAKAGIASAVAMTGVIVLAQNYVPFFNQQLNKYKNQPGSQYTGRLLLICGAGLAGFAITAEQSMLACTRSKSASMKAEAENGS